jgi:polyhydroxyalkanoate synthesis repressor PhaR
LGGRNQKSSGEHCEQKTQRIIKKYPNRRLYDTVNSCYVTLSEVRKLIIDHQSLIVLDAKTQEDITRSILLQIIIEEESGGMPLFSEAALINIIRFYGQFMQGFMGEYLEKNMQSFMDLQREMMGSNKIPTPELWQELFKLTSPLNKSASFSTTSSASTELLESYLKRSRDAFDQMQKQLNHQTDELLEALRFKSSK